MLPVGSAPLWWLAPPPLPATRSGDKRKAPLNFSFPLEGKCHEVAKGCTRVRMIMILRCCSMHRLTSPDLHILCRMCTVGLWVLGSGVNLSLWQQQRENHTTGLAPVEMHPFCRLSATSLHGKASHTIFRLLRSLTNRVRLPPRRGRFALCSTSGRISISRHNAAKTSPSGGRTAAGGDRGAFPKGEARLYGFPFRGAEL